MTQFIADYFDKACDKFQKGWQASLWESEDDQYARYVLASRLITNKLTDKFCSVLDVGCGYGDFSSYLKGRFNNIIYKGIDLSPLMVRNANAKYPGIDVVKQDVLDESFVGKFDYVFSIGGCSVMSQPNDYDGQMDYLAKVMKKMSALSSKGVCLTMPCDSAGEKYKDLYYYSPCKVLTIALDLTFSVVINTAAIPGELIVFMYWE